MNGDNHADIFKKDYQINFRKFDAYNVIRRHITHDFVQGSLNLQDDFCHDCCASVSA